MNTFRIFCYVSIFLSSTYLIICYADTDCYNDKRKEMNQVFLEKINQIRAEKSLSPLVLNDLLIGDAAEWVKYLTTIDKPQTSDPNTCKYAEFTFHFNGEGPYDETITDPVEKWMYEIEKGGLKGLPDQENQILWNRTKAIGCGVCSYEGKAYTGSEDTKTTIISCRVTPLGKSFFKDE